MTRALNLLLHCGAAKTERDQVAKATTPVATDTWHPIPHTELISLLVDSLPEYGLTIVNEAHGMTKEGDRYFGMFQVAGEQNPDDFALVFGVRNSHDKSFPAGLCCGSGVFVCDNLCFSSDIVVGRRHTKFIMRDLPALFAKAMGKLMEARVTQEQRLEAYKQTEIDRRQAIEIVVDAVKRGALPKTKIMEVVAGWDAPEYDEFAQREDVWRLFNSFTQSYRDSNKASRALSVTGMTQKTTKLHGMLDNVCGLIESTEKIMDDAGIEDATFEVRR